MHSSRHHALYVHQAPVAALMAQHISNHWRAPLSFHSHHSHWAADKHQYREKMSASGNTAEVLLLYWDHFGEAGPVISFPAPSCAESPGRSQGLGSAAQAPPVVCHLWPRGGTSSALCKGHVCQEGRPLGGWASRVRSLLIRSWCDQMLSRLSTLSKESLQIRTCERNSESMMTAQRKLSPDKSSRVFGVLAKRLSSRTRLSERRVEGREMSFSMVKSF